MKKKVALPIIISSSVIGLIVIAVIVLSVVFVNPLTSFVGGYKSVDMYNTDTSGLYPTTEDSVKAVDGGIKDTRFSVMQAILEGRFNYSPKFKLEENEDGEKERASLGIAGIRNLTPSDGEYMLLFAYDKAKTVKVEGEPVTFDKAKVLVYDTNGEIERIVIYPYLQEKLDVTPVDSYYYSYAIEIWSTTTKLTNVLSDYNSYLK